MQNGGPLSASKRQLLNSLRDGSSRTRCLALKKLREIELDETLTNAVVQLFHNDQRSINRLEALNVLRKEWPDERAVRVFTESFSCEHFIAEHAVTILGDIADDRAFNLLETAFLTAKNVWVKINVLSVYHRASQARILEFLKRTSVLYCAEDNIRATAVAMLRRVENPTLARVFLEMMKDKNDRVRANAVEGLGKCLEGPQLTNFLMPLVEDRNNRVRANVLVLLLKQGIRQAERYLSDMVLHANALYRASAAYVLGEIPYAPSRRVMLNTLLDDNHSLVSKQAEKALEKRMAA